MTPIIHLAFVDDWELRGDGSGDVYEIQIRPMRELAHIFESCGIRGSFNAELMQQLAHRKNHDEHPELRAIADAWDEAVLDVYRRGHDVQLHVHPQWKDARRANGRWHLTADWSILNHGRDAALEMISECKAYLETLIRRVDPEYRCLTFRSGSWCIAPSDFMLELLAELGIIFDMSIVGGVRYLTKNIDLDYTVCEETFLPYYPVMSDARKVSDKTAPIICVPTNHFYGSRRQVFRHHLKQGLDVVRRRIRPQAARAAPAYGQEWEQVSHASTMTRIYEKGLVPYVMGKHLISDIAQLDGALLSEMLASIRRRARASGLAHVPVILENHTKDITDFSAIERFVRHVSAASDIKCVTLGELADGFVERRFAVRRKVSGE